MKKNWWQSPLGYYHEFLFSPKLKRGDHVHTIDKSFKAGHSLPTVMVIGDHKMDLKEGKKKKKKGWWLG